MAKTLVTKLNGITDNKELKFFDSLKFKCNYRGTLTNRATLGSPNYFFWGDGVEVRLEGNATFQDGSTKLLLQNSPFDFSIIANGEFYLSLIGKSKIRHFVYSFFDAGYNIVARMVPLFYFEDALYCKNMTTFLTLKDYVVGDVSKLSRMQNLTSITCQDGCYGSLDWLADNEKITDVSIASDNVTGNVANVLKNITRKYISMNKAKGLSGDLSKVNKAIEKITFSDSNTYFTNDTVYTWTDGGRTSENVVPALYRVCMTQENAVRYFMEASKCAASSDSNNRFIAVYCIDKENYNSSAVDSYIEILRGKGYNVVYVKFLPVD